MMLEVKDLHVSYGGIRALKGMSLAVEKGEIDPGRPEPHPDDYRPHPGGPLGHPRRFERRGRFPGIGRFRLYARGDCAG